MRRASSVFEANIKWSIILRLSTAFVFSYTLVKKTPRILQLKSNSDGTKKIHIKSNIFVSFKQTSQSPNFFYIIQNASVVIMVVACAGTIFNLAESDRTVLISSTFLFFDRIFPSTTFAKVVQF